MIELPKKLLESSKNLPIKKLLESFKNLLESFKTNKYSKYIEEEIQPFIFSVLKGKYAPYLSPLIAPYFDHVNAHGARLSGINLDNQLIVKIKKLLLKINTQNLIVIPKIDLNEEILTKITELIYTTNKKGGSLFADFQLDANIISMAQTLIQEINLKNGVLAAPLKLNENSVTKLKRLIRTINIKNAFFTKFDQEPDNISQIKKLLNAMYYARLAFIDLENLDISKDKATKSVQRLLSSSEMAYKATYLATHLDVNLTGLLRGELEIILPQLIRIQQFAQNHTEETKKVIKAFPFSFTAGKVTGTTIDQMRPLGSDVDYNFLTQFSGLLPGYIHKLTQYIQKYSSQIKKNEPKLNQEKLDELRNAALNLLNDIEQLKGGSVFISLKILNYLNIISNVILLSQSTLEQIGELSESSQNVVRDKLALLKYTIFPTLFGLLDEIEVNTMVKPGTFSQPLMEQVKALYQAIIYLPSKAINFHANGKEFLGIEDSRFIEARLELAYKRIDIANKALFKTQKNQEALEQFFTELKKPEHANMNLRKLPIEVKKRLVKHYKVIQLSMKELDVDFNELIMKSLLSSLEAVKNTSWYSPVANSWQKAKKIKWSSSVANSWEKVKNINWSSYLPNTQNIQPSNTLWSLWNKITNKNWATPTIKTLRKCTQTPDYFKHKPDDHISFVLAKEKALQELFLKNQNSQIFHIALNKDLIASVHKHTKLSLIPYSERRNVFIINEAAAIGIEPERYRFVLKKAEFLELRTAFINLIKLVKKHIKNEEEFEEFLTLDNLDNKEKKQYEDLYDKLHPYFTLLVPTKQEKAISNLTRYLAAILADNKVETENIPTTAEFLLLAKESQFALEKIKNTWVNSHEIFYNLENSQFLSIKEMVVFTPQLEKTKFLTLETAFIRFCHLTQKKISADNQFLALDKLDNKTKMKCHALYNKFRPYFSYFFPKNANKDDILSLYTYLNTALTQITTHEKIVFPVALFLKLTQQVQKNLDKIKAAWADENDIYSVEANKLLRSISSATVPQPKKMNLQFIADSNDIITKNTELLTADQALELSQHYKNKYIKLEIAERAYLTFKELLQPRIEQLRKNNCIDLQLDNLTPEIKDQCRNLYSIFQPYFISVLAPNKRSPILEIDRYLLKTLDNNKADPQPNKAKWSTASRKTSQAPSINEFLKLGKQFQNFLIEKKSKWKEQDQNYYERAEKKFNSENEAAILTPKASNDDRAHHLLKHTHYSKGVHDFRMTLFKMQAHFNQSMQKALVSKPSGLPYPEMEDQFKQLMQNKQVRVIKDIYNSLYHLERIIVALEQLEDHNLHEASSFKWIEDILTKAETGNYLWHLAQAHNHIMAIKSLSQRLATDPHYGMIARELVHKAQILYAKFKEHSNAYQVAPTEVPLPGVVEYNSLWYVLNAFYIGPQHIRSLTNINYLTAKEQKELHQHAKNATLIVQKLIHSSSSIFKLFLQAPTMILFYQELTSKLNQFTTTAHDAVLNNVSKIRATIFTPMLLEADHWETKLGLAPGSFSEPLRQILNEYYKGLIGKLHLKSEQHIALICDEIPLIERTACVAKQIDKTQKKIKKVDSYYADLVDLHNKIESDEQTFKRAPPTKADINALYKKVLPKLTRLKVAKKIHVEPSISPADHVYDQICNDGLKEYDPHFTEVKSWVATSYHYYLGLKATHQMTLETCTEKHSQLTQLSAIQKKEKEQFIEHYTKTAFKKHLDDLCNRDIDLQFGSEYREKLHKYIMIFKDQIIEKTKTAQDIDQGIKNLLQEKNNFFAKKHYKTYYQYDLVLVALAEFRIYFKRCKENSIFETNKSINNKSKKITEIEKIAYNKVLSIEDRLKKIREHVEDPNFKTTIFSACKANIFSWNNLKRCFFYLLEALYLFTPTRKVLYKKLYDSLDKPLKIDGLAGKMGLFAPLDKVRADPHKTRPNKETTHPQLSPAEVLRSRMIQFIN